MKKKLNDKLALNRETLHTLTRRDMRDAMGGGTTSDTNTSNVTDTCATCLGPSCAHPGPSINPTLNSLCC
ncbi:MAG TPA: class I lanthipeptide [Thermoanaerobaculia bacterium]|nr:class I lanthipeptide [Thermoanaerobaculia bacterium]